MHGLKVCGEQCVHLGSAEVVDLDLHAWSVPRGTPVRGRVHRVVSRRRYSHRMGTTAWIVIAGIVGLTRMYLGYHFLTDVAAGACVGLFTLGLVVTVDRLMDLKRDLPEGAQPA